MKAEKNEMILVFENKSFIEKTKNEVEATKQAMQGIVSAWNDLNFGELQSQELSLLVSDPKRLFKQRIDSRIETPTGLLIEKYLQLVETPDLSLVLKQRDSLVKHPFCMTFELFGLDGAIVTINDEELGYLLKTQNSYYPRASKELQICETIINAVKNFNELNRLTGFELVNGRSDAFDKYFTKRQITNYNYALEIDYSKLAALVKQAASVIN